MPCGGERTDVYSILILSFSLAPWGSVSARFSAKSTEMLLRWCLGIANLKQTVWVHWSYRPSRGDQIFSEKLSTAKFFQQIDMVQAGGTGNRANWIIVSPNEKANRQDLRTKTKVLSQRWNDVEWLWTNTCCKPCVSGQTCCPAIPMLSEKTSVQLCSFRDRKQGTRKELTRRAVFSGNVASRDALQNSMTMTRYDKTRHNKCEYIVHPCTSTYIHTSGPSRYQISSQGFAGWHMPGVNGFPLTQVKHSSDLAICLKRHHLNILGQGLSPVMLWTKGSKGFNKGANSIFLCISNFWLAICLLHQVFIAFLLRKFGMHEAKAGSRITAVADLGDANGCEHLSTVAWKSWNVLKPVCHSKHFKSPEEPAQRQQQNKAGVSISSTSRVLKRSSDKRPLSRQKHNFCLTPWWHANSSQLCRILWLNCLESHVYWRAWPNQTAWGIENKGDTQL